MKRKRGKLNLEKAISKNIFDDKTIKPSLFVGSEFETIKEIQNKPEETTTKTTKNRTTKQKTISFSDETLSIDNSSQPHLQSNVNHATHTTLSTPPLQKIALKLRKITENLNKKGKSEGIISRNLKELNDSLLLETANALLEYEKSHNTLITSSVDTNESPNKTIDIIEPIETSN
jgi:hypothetical protein